ncbi:MAG: hypothetical protein JXA54_15135 [Candidatus Heimdallarchaeota archaeon]|nr:hypothetical protein [Candidatus Heimdallarchaeota archaeon]
MNVLLRKLQILTLLIVIIIPIFPLQQCPLRESTNSSKTDTFDVSTLELIFSNQNFESNDSFSSNFVWSKPYQITAPQLIRDDYLFVRDSNGIFHGVLIKHLSYYGDELNYIYSSDNTTNNWTIPKVILRTDSETSISNLNLLVDNNNTLHLSYISKRESIWQINYLFKYVNQSVWSSSSTLKREYNNEYSSLTSTLTNNVIELAWIKKQLPINGNLINSTILLISKNLTLNEWMKIKSIYDDINPIKVGLSFSATNMLGLVYTVLDDLTSSYKMYFSNSSDFGENWSNSVFIYEYVKNFEKLDIYPSTITGGYHLLGNEILSPKKLHHLEIYENGTTYISDEIISELNDGCFAGIIENTSSEDIYIFYEGGNSGKFDIYYRKRSGSNLTWESEQKVTNDDHSFSPIFIAENIETSINYGVVIYTSFQSLKTSQFNKTEFLSDEQLIYQSTRSNGQGSIGVDSTKTIHFIWEYVGTYNTKVYYEYKTQNGSWQIMESIAGTHFTSSVSPKLLVDSLDNIHCFFIADDLLSGFNGLYYVTKKANQNNWSEPLLITEPNGYAQSNNYDAIIDNEDTIHIVWAEQTGIYQNRLYYSYKMINEEVFTTIIIQSDNYLVACYNPSFVIDTAGTLHLVYTEHDRNYPINYLRYRFRLAGQVWSDKTTIVLSTIYALFRPLLTIDSNNVLRMIYLKEYFNGAFLVADSVLYRKMQFGSWTLNGTLYSNEMINYHEFFITENDRLVYAQHINNIPIDSFPDSSYDFVCVTTTDLTSSWTEREIIFRNPLYKNEPIGIYDENTKNVFFVINDKQSTFIYNHLIYRQYDTDSDFLGDDDEELFGTNPLDQDSDQDMIFDGIEINIYHTNPALNDTDWDTVLDGEEIFIYQSNPLVLDTDQDSIPDGDEVFIYNTNPILIDSDSDGLTDYAEIFVYGTNPNNEDSDLDNMPDLWEINNNLNPLFDDSLQDNDNDDLNNLEEFQYNTYPNLNDTDSDGLLDGEEIKVWLTDPLSIDTDSDTITDYDEVMIFHTNPLLPDTDGDGFTDREEINEGTDPNNPKDNIRRNKIEKILLSTIIPIIGLSILYGVLEMNYRLRLRKQLELEREEQILEEERLTQLTMSKE